MWSCTSSSESAGAGAGESLSSALQTLLCLQCLCHSLEAGDISLPSGSENKHDPCIHFKHLRPVPELSPFQTLGLLLRWQKDSLGDSYFHSPTFW